MQQVDAISTEPHSISTEMRGTDDPLVPTPCATGGEHRVSGDKLATMRDVWDAAQIRWPTDSVSRDM